MKAASRQRKSSAFQTMDRAAEVACYYGFAPLPAAFRVRQEDRERVRSLQSASGKGRSNEAAMPTIEEHAALLRHVEKERFEEKPLPALLYALLDSSGEGRKKRGEKHLLLSAIGSGKSIVEALLIQTASAVLLEEGHASVCLSINSIGDRDSANRFFRELNAYYRKNLDRFPASCRTLLQKNQMVLACAHEKCRLVAEEAPKPIASLSEASRAHFKEVLEYLEELRIPYRIDHTLIGPAALQSEIVFEFRPADAKENAPALTAGMRSNNLARRFGARKEIPYVCAAVSLAREKTQGALRQVLIKKSTLFFLQLGTEAKLKSLRVIERLRCAHIPLCHSLARDKLISQLSAQEHLNTPYSLIMGQREALEDAIIVRNTATRAQETVKISELVAYLKKRKIA
ncbi:MAG: histidyl-tRNA synthetase [Parcubacteria group bacterium Greene0416_79]|nr:MAG: histidyl-tRNA synthetase [Parcubacteria group bacterium Greene0416_79]